MKKKKRFLLVANASLIFSMSLASSGFASGYEQTTKVDNDQIRPQAYTIKLDEGSPINLSPTLKSSDSDTEVRIERSSVAPVYDENGTVIDTVNIMKNVNEKNTNSRSAGKLVTVLVAVDEEYRNKHTNWQSLVAGVVEGADDAFNSEFNIDFTITGYRYWSSTGSDASQLLTNLKGSGNEPYDFVIGFTAEPDFFGDSGYLAGLTVTQYSAPSTAVYIAMYDQSIPSDNWHALQHEVSHNYSLQHDSQMCIMNYNTMYATNSWDAAHRSQIAARVNWYGTNTN